jgi:hypothetical protein
MPHDDDGIIRLRLLREWEGDQFRPLGHLEANQAVFRTVPQAQMQPCCLLGMLRPVLQWGPAEVTIETTAPLGLYKRPEISEGETPVKQSMEVLVLVGLEAFITTFLAAPGVFGTTPVGALLLQRLFNEVQDRWDALPGFTEVAAETGAIDMGIDDLDHRQ